MWEPKRTIHVPTRLQRAKIVINMFQLVLIKVNHMVLEADTLNKPTRRMIAPAEVEEDIHRRRAVVWNMADSLLGHALTQLVREDRPVEHLLRVPLVHMEVLVEVRRAKVLDRGQRLRAEPLVVPIRHPHDDRVRRGAL